MRTAAWLGLAALLLAAPADAQWDARGHVKYQLSWEHFRPGDLGERLVAPDPVDHTVDGRLALAWRHRRLDVTADVELLALAGDTVAALGSAPAGGPAVLLGGLPDLGDTRQWLDLGWDRAAGDRGRIAARLDRLSAGYTGDHFVARLGRQALSWGNGLVFQTLDLFDPFPPNVLDVDYKPGRDMLTTQWLFDSGDDLQALVVPGRAARGQPLTMRESSMAAKWHHLAGGTELDLLAARHHGDTVLGGGLTHGIAQGVARVDVTYARLPDGHATSMLVNFDRAWTLGGRTLYAFGEYFYNGFGATGLGAGPIALEPALLARLERGEVFNLGRHELAGGVRYEWTPLLTLSPTAIVDLADGSAFALVEARYDWTQDLVLFAGLQAGLGARGTEYGGATAIGVPGYLAPGVRVWTRLARYF